MSPTSQQVRARPSSPPAGQPALQSYAVLIAVAACVVLLDQGTKALVTSSLAGGRVVRVAGGLVYLDYVRNTGAAFSLLRGGGWLFAVLAVAISAGIVVFYRRLRGAPLTVRLALGLVLGGAVGNLVDRVRLGYVVDFVDLRWWPVFNVADSCIVVGVVLLIAASLGPRAGGSRE